MARARSRSGVFSPTVPGYSPFTGPTPVICGPTAGGKSALGVELGRLILERTGRPACILAADAFQVYRGMDIGTAKPTSAERGGIEHRLIDLFEPDRAEAFTVADWLGLAEPMIAELRARGVVPIVVGGTHLYVKALLEGLFEGPPPDLKLRARLAALSPSELRARLVEVDPVAAGRIHANDVRRTIRALEVFERTGKPISSLQTQWDAKTDEQSSATGRPGASAYQLVVLDWPAELLNRRINARVKEMFERGLVDEVRGLERAGKLGPQAREAVGYKQLLGVPDHPERIREAMEQVKIQTRRLGKNQRTWLGRLRLTPGCLVLPASEVTVAEQAEAVFARLGVNTIAQ